MDEVFIMKLLRSEWLHNARYEVVTKPVIKPEAS